MITYYKRSVQDTLDGILLFTIFMITWVPINLICLFKKDLNWVQIKHTSKESIKEIVKENRS